MDHRSHQRAKRRTIRNEKKYNRRRLLREQLHRKIEVWKARKLAERQDYVNAMVWNALWS